MSHFLAALLAAFVTLFHGDTPTFPKIADQVEQSVVRITGNITAPADTDPQNLEYVCTGFVIAPLRVLTAAHCIIEAVKADGVPVVLVAMDDYTDLALLAVPTDKPVLPFDDKKVARFEDLLAFGHGYGFNSVITLGVRAFLLNYRSPFQTQEGQLAPVGILVQPAYIHGMSGGPVVNRYGRVVGIVQQANEGVGWGITTQIIKTFLLEAGLEL